MRKITLALAFLTCFVATTGFGAEQINVDSLKALAEKGNVDAQLKLGLNYEDEANDSKDLTEAARWFQMAADQGNVYALMWLGRQKIDGLGVEKNLAEGFSKILLAAELGEVAAQGLIGQAYMSGLGVRKDVAEGYKWLSVATYRGNAYAAKIKSKYNERFRLSETAAAYQKAVEWSPKVFSRKASLAKGQLATEKQLFPSGHGNLVGDFRTEIRVCTDADGKVIGDPSTIKPSSSEEFNKASREWAGRASYLSQVVKGTAEPSCLDFAMTFKGKGEYKPAFVDPANKKDEWIKSVDAQRLRLPRQQGDGIILEDLYRDGGDGIIYKFKYQRIDLASTSKSVLQTLSASLPYVPADQACKRSDTSEVIYEYAYLKYVFLDKNGAQIANTPKIDHEYCSVVPGYAADGSQRVAPKPDVSVKVSGDYPLKAKADSINGKVELRACVGRDGMLIADPVVIGPVHPLLDAAAAKSAKNTRFFPGTVDGQAATMCFRYNVKFATQDEKKQSLFDAVFEGLIIGVTQGLVAK